MSFSDKANEEGMTRRDCKKKVRRPEVNGMRGRERQTDVMEPGKKAVERNGRREGRNR